MTLTKECRVRTDPIRQIDKSGEMPAARLSLCQFQPDMRRWWHDPRQLYENTASKGYRHVAHLGIIAPMPVGITGRTAMMSGDSREENPFSSFPYDRQDVTDDPCERPVLQDRGGQPPMTQVGVNAMRAENRGPKVFFVHRLGGCGTLAQFAKARKPSPHYNHLIQINLEDISFTRDANYACHSKLKRDRSNIKEMRKNGLCPTVVE